MDKLPSKRGLESAKSPISISAKPERHSQKASKPKPRPSDKHAKIPSSSSFVRLHISPLTAESAKAIVSEEHVKNASYHTIETFPEKSYGFLTVPHHEAEKLKKKFNGTLFRGVKMSVDDARPVKSVSIKETVQQSEAAVEEKSSRQKFREAKEDGVLPGFELPNGRQVKRGWTKDNHVTGSGKSTTGAVKSECLFKTILPPVIAVNVALDKVNSKEEKRDKEKPKKKMTAKGGSRKNQVVIKEFRNTTKFPEFLKMNALPTSSSSQRVEYVEGLGWIDTDGNLVEAASTKRRRVDNDTTAPTLTNGNNIAQDQLSTRQSDQKSTTNTGFESENAHGDKLDSGDTSSNTSDSDTDAETGSESDRSDELTDDGRSYTKSRRPVVSRSPSPSSSSSTTSSEEDEGAEDSSGSESESSDSVETGETTSAYRVNVPAALPTTANATEGTVAAEAKGSANFQNLSNIFKPKLSLDTDTTSAFKFFDDDMEVEDADYVVDDATNGITKVQANDDTQIGYTPVTPRVDRYRSAAPTPDTAVASKFREKLPFENDISVTRDYFPTMAREGALNGKSSTSNGIGLLFPHSNNTSIHALSIWSSVVLPEILTTGKIIDRRHNPKRHDDKSIDEKDDVPALDVKEPTNPAKPYYKQPSIPVHDRNIHPPEDAGKPKTGSGSGIAGWSGTKKTFDDENETVSPYNPTGPLKARTGAGSGVTGWSGTKKTFGEDSDELMTDSIVKPGHLEAPKAKTGIGSGVVGWAGKKKTFDDDEESETDDKVEKLTVVKGLVNSSKKIDTMSASPVDPEVLNLPLAKVWEKVFYENRGEWNRQWKRKRRESAKAKRKKDNAKRGWLSLPSAD